MTTVLRATYGVSPSYSAEEAWVGTKDGLMTRPPLVWVHGSGETAASVVTNPFYQPTLHALTEFFTVFVGDFMKEAGWGCANHVTRIEEARSWMAGQGATGALSLFGVSMGNLGMMNYARTYSGNVRCVVGNIPVCDLLDMRDNRGFSSQIAQAYPTGSTQTADIEARNPVRWAGTQLSQTTPMLLLPSSADTIVVPSTIEAFRAARPSTVIQDIGTNGHNGNSFTTAIPYIVRFLRALAL